MYQRTITYAKENDENLTIRELLQKWLIPKKWQHLLRIKQDVLLNSSYHPFNTTVKDQDELTLKFDFPARTKHQTYLPGKRKLDVAYEDDDVLVVNKPANVKTHPNLPTEDDSLFNDVQKYLSPEHPYMVHRIDMLTNGLVLISKNPYLVPIFNRQLTNKTLKRNYLAIVELKKPLKSDGVINLPIGLDDNDKRKRQISTTGQSAMTDYKILRKNSRYALVELNLHSGRTHQIRVHLSSQGWPIVNDTLYNSSKPNGNMLLSAYKLTYQVPFSNKFNTVEIAANSDMTEFIKKNDIKKVPDHQ